MGIYPHVAIRDAVQKANNFESCADAIQTAFLLVRKHPEGFKVSLEQANNQHDTSTLLEAGLAYHHDNKLFASQELIDLSR